MSAGTDRHDLLDLPGLDLAAVDPAAMLATVEDSGAQWDSALATALDAPPPEFPADAPVTIIAGMGGSGIAGDVAALAAARGGRGAVVPVKGYDLPAYVGPHTPVIAVSYSGNTEETRSCVDQARAAGAPLYIVTSGGAIGALADEHGLPGTRIVGGGQPRASLPTLTAPVLVALERAGIISGAIDLLGGVGAHVTSLAEAWSHRVPADSNEVKRTALALDGLIPVLYGGSGVGAAVALRAKCQINENGKRPAFWAEYPELDHNEVVGWEKLPVATAGFGLVELRDPEDHRQVMRRFDATRAIVGDGFGAIIEHTLLGDDWLSRLAAGVLFVDLLSVHLGLLEGADPTPVRVIEDLKRRIAD